MSFSSYVDDVPSPWPLPRPSMCLQAFQLALAKRQLALDRLQQHQHSSESVPAFEMTSTDDRVAIFDLSSLKDHQVRVDDSIFADSACQVELILKAALQASDDVRRLRDEDGFTARDCRKRKREMSNFSEMNIEGNAVRTLDQNRRIECDIDARVAMDEDEKCDEMDCEQVTVKSLSISEIDGKPVHNLEIKHVESKFRMGDTEGDEYPIHAENGHGIRKEKEIEKLEAPRTPLTKDAECVKPIHRAARLEAFVSASVHSPTKSAFETWQTTNESDLEAKLKRVQETKHQLVQMLKQGFYG